MKKIAIIIALAMVGATGCKKFLEPQSQSETIPTRVSQLSELLLTALPDPSANERNGLTRGYLDLMSDDVQVRGLISTETASDIWYTQPYVAAVEAIFQWQPDYSTRMLQNFYPGHDQIYKDSYNKLEYVNSVLDYVDKVSGSAGEKNYVIAQALALRAFYYLNLVNIYGQPYVDGPDGQGIPLRLIGAKETRPMVRNTVDEVYDRVVTDLTDAVELFEGLSAEQQYQTFRPTMPMAMLLLARAYLYMGNWERAEFWAQRLITEWGEQFKVNDLSKLGVANPNAPLPDPNKLDITNYDPNDARKQKFWKDFATYKNKDVIWAYGDVDDLVDLSSKDISQGGPQNTRVFGNGVYAALLQASTSLVDTYDDNDLRLRTYLVRDLFAEYKDENAGKSYPEGTALGENHRFKFYKAYAKVNLSYDESTGLPGEGKFKPTNDIGDYGYTLRITEAWLILAEAQAEQGKASARASLQEVQRKRFIDGIIPARYTTASVLEDVRAERRREFCFEALRWNDLRRWGQPRLEHVWYDVSRNSTEPRKYVLQQGDFGYTLPMSITILNANPNLTQVPLASERMPQ